MSKKKFKRKPTETFNISLTLPSDSLVMTEIKKLVRDGYSFGLAIKKVLVEWKPPVEEKTWKAEDVLSMMRLIAGTNTIDTPMVNYSEEIKV
jgi:hypothetical protein